ncbi:hypothetical protein F8M49_30035 [Rhodococcus zopfii]|uniref:Uncharacterized protein n=1 Tax=Rhodococcus zopfii TaxID=43772 RepID=A0ABU3WX71_9NOCA|nr:hypothetical protein [Rhodococcus zopfii]MDV2478602.1 hypothetical protein [Rhodococcus zopfii]
MTIIDFIEARLTEDKQIATKAGTGKYARWDYAGDCDSASNGEVYYPDTRTVVRHMNGHESLSYDCVTCDSEGLTPSVNQQIGPHIARHDPARVRRQCKAIRTIVDDLADYQLSHFDPTLKAIAVIWSDHPDYRSEWR